MFELARSPYFYTKTVIRGIFNPKEVVEIKFWNNCQSISVSSIRLIDYQFSGNVLEKNKVQQSFNNLSFGSFLLGNGDDP